MRQKTLTEIRSGPTEDGVGYVFRSNSGFPLLATDKVIADRFDGQNKRKIGLSVSSGCTVGCIYCFSRQYRHFYPLTEEELVEQAGTLLEKPVPALIEGTIDLTKISFKQMGDPSLNADAVCRAIRRLGSQDPAFQFVVSTSAPRSTDLVEELLVLREAGMDIRLQFSCHTTSDQERRRLSPHLPMCSLAEIAALVERWRSPRVTLNFMMLEGFTYDVERIVRLFRPDQVLIKLNYLDPNRFTTLCQLADMDLSKRKVLAKRLTKEGYPVAFRRGFDRPLFARESCSPAG